MIQPALDGQERVINGALRSTRLPASSIDYVNLHGTSTTMGAFLLQVLDTPSDLLLDRMGDHRDQELDGCRPKIPPR